MIKERHVPLINADLQISNYSLPTFSSYYIRETDNVILLMACFVVLTNPTHISPRAPAQTVCVGVTPLMFRPNILNVCRMFILIRSEPAGVSKLEASVLAGAQKLPRGT